MGNVWRHDRKNCVVIGTGTGFVAGGTKDDRETVRGGTEGVGVERLLAL